MLTVLDASVMIAALLKDEEHNQSAKEIVKNLPAGDCTTPAIFWYEVRNVLLMAMKRGRIEQSDLNACFNLPKISRPLWMTNTTKWRL